MAKTNTTDNTGRVQMRASVARSEDNGLASSPQTRRRQRSAQEDDAGFEEPPTRRQRTSEVDSGGYISWNLDETQLLALFSAIEPSRVSSELQTGLTPLADWLLSKTTHASTGPRAAVAEAVTAASRWATPVPESRAPSELPEPSAPTLPVRDEACHTTEVNQPPSDSKLKADRRGAYPLNPAIYKAVECSGLGIGAELGLVITNIATRLEEMTDDQLREYAISTRGVFENNNEIQTFPTREDAYPLENSHTRIVKSLLAHNTKDKTLGFSRLCASMRLALDVMAVRRTWEMTNDDKLSLQRYYNSYVESEKISIKLETLRGDYYIGLKALYLAYGGGIHLLLGLSSTDSRTRIKGMAQQDVLQVARVARYADPKAYKDKTDQSCASLFVNTIFPAVEIMRNAWPSIAASTLFGRELLTALGITDDVLLSDSKEADRFYSAIPFNVPGFAPFQSRLYTPQDRSSPYDYPLHLPCRRILSTYDPAANMPCHAPKDHEANFKWTEAERACAERAPVVRTVKELEKSLKAMYRNGRRVYNKGQYLKVDRTIAVHQGIRLEGSQNKAFAYLNNTMPNALRRVAHDKLYALLRADKNLTRKVDTKEEGVNHAAPALYMCFFNRMSEKGKNAPTDVNPYLLVKYRDGRQIRTNYSQILPTESKQMKDSIVLANELLEAFAPIFEYLREVLRRDLQEEIVSMGLDIDVDSLPLGSNCPLPPLTNVVVNFTLCTPAHRDVHDKTLCGIFVVGDFSGGELVLYEPGLVLTLSTGDFCVFNSTQITHFNLHLKGTRIAFVFQTDAQINSWVEDRNGWDKNIYMHAIPSTFTASHPAPPTN